MEGIEGNTNEMVSCGGAGRAALPSAMPSPVSRLASSAPNWANAWRFPFGTNEYDSAWAFSWGKLRFVLGDAIERGLYGLPPGANEAAYCWIEIRPRWTGSRHVRADADLPRLKIESPCGRFMLVAYRDSQTGVDDVIVGGLRDGRVLAEEHGAGWLEKLEVGWRSDSVALWPGKVVPCGTVWGYPSDGPCSDVFVGFGGNFLTDFCPVSL